MRRSFLTWLLVLTTTVLVAACCGSVACECNDTYADAVGLQFSLANSQDSLRGFFPSYIDTVYLVRNPRDTTQRPRADTVALTRSRAVVFTQPIIINNATPFGLVTGRKLNAYRYTLYLAKRRRATPTYTYKLDSIQLSTRYQGDGCCTCYQNSSKKVFVTNQKGVSQQFDLTDTGGNNELKTITMERF
ncbi:hypothetical protein HNQ93_001859 [Hymenobacter luteus]|uniref:DUF4251 domain-containing protein n=2 Tax=Hymenobacter TaxID=89966 RepID=A0A7W9T1N0_9BACT|nr:MULTISPECIES: hypothetical protein [Hymenobacter]MBB4600780.1 hypothetical protein [Hymenobacter latericoloratus]MBB6059013.1 hypothetical protein [Hymenobacter luteus]